MCLVSGLPQPGAVASPADHRPCPASCGKAAHSTVTKGGCGNSVVVNGVVDGGISDP